MKSVLRLLACLFTLLLLCLPWALSETALPSEVEVFFFHDTDCGTCDGISDFREAFYALLGAETELYPFRIYYENVFELGGKQAWELALDRFGLSGENIQFPAMLVGGKLFSGMEAIQNNLREAFLTAGEDIFTYGYVYNPKQPEAELFSRYAVDADASVVVYFYRITCEECGQTKPVIEALPATVTVDGSPSQVRILPFNTRSGNNRDRISAFFAAYQVPPEDQMVPIAFIRDRYFAGFEQISAGLADALAAGEAAGFQFPTAD